MVNVMKNKQFILVNKNKQVMALLYICRDTMILTTMICNIPLTFIEGLLLVFQPNACTFQNKLRKYCFGISRI